MRLTVFPLTSLCFVAAITTGFHLISYHYAESLADRNAVRVDIPIVPPVAHTRYGVAILPHLRSLASLHMYLSAADGLHPHRRRLIFPMSSMRACSDRSTTTFSFVLDVSAFPYVVLHPRLVKFTSGLDSGTLPSNI